MDYEVTAIRKRPQVFEELIGQDFVVSTIRNSLKNRQMAHAYLFSGPRGCGKTSAARLFAKALNCSTGPNDNPCGKSPSCLEISQGGSLDVIEIDGASNTSVNDVRQIRDEVLFAPTASRYKVYIIDEVHMLSNSAFNALLKTIEEPPEYVIFIFATTEIQKVPATIRSRCQQFNFRLISLEGIKTALAKVSAEAGIRSEDDALTWIARQATGSLRDAYTLFDQIAAFSDGSIGLEMINRKLGMAGLDNISGLLETLVHGDVAALVFRIDEILLGGISVEQCAIELIDYFRSMILVKNGIRKIEILGYSADRFPPDIIGAYSPTQAECALSLLLSLFRDLRYSVNQRYELELALIRIRDLKTYIAPSEILERISRLREEIVGKTSADEIKSAVISAGKENDESNSSEGAVQNPRSETGMNADDIKKRLLSILKKDKVALASILEKTEEWVISGETLTLNFDSPYGESFARQEIGYISQKINELSDTTYSIRINLKVNSCKEGTAVADREMGDNVEIVKKMFKGTIVGKEQEDA
jgi:DNA polymerase III subunit gamma/tau